MAYAYNRPPYRERFNSRRRGFWFTGLSGSDKPTLAGLVEGRRTCLLDDDKVCHGLSRDLGFSDRGRIENIRCTGEMSWLFVDAGMVTLTAFIFLFRGDRDAERERMAVTSSRYSSIFRMPCVSFALPPSCH
ncbi:adenylyl-sulfate kinase [Chromohalobacter israelensis]|uniref:adenylyl-sulfate kinase n=1 Tax=Chromohalobacter israelensis TaxID=141390 RepID=UPI0015C44736